MCFCGEEAFSGDGRYVTVEYETRPRMTKGGYVGTRQVSGYLETCQECGDKAITNEDGTALRFIRETDTVTAPPMEA